MTFSNWRLGRLINRAQTVFVGMLRIWSIPIVLMLSVASGFTTYYGMAHFITWWIALIITIAVQSIIVICTLEIAGIHWKANRMRYLTVFISLLIALAASISFSYFKFYEISQKDTIRIVRLDQVRHEINRYLADISNMKSEILGEQKEKLNRIALETTQAYLGTHPNMSPRYKNKVGGGPVWRHYNELQKAEKKILGDMEQDFSKFDGKLRILQSNVNSLDITSDAFKREYHRVITAAQEVQLHFNALTTRTGHSVPPPPELMTYAQFSQEIQPSTAMWKGFSLFAFICAAMVDFFTVLLSYRLELTAPGPLTEQEEDLVFECLNQFTEFRINENDELELVIEKTEIERARRYSDLSRKFAVGFLLSRGFLRKVDAKTVEFAPNLYPLVAERMGKKLKAIKTVTQPPPPATAINDGDYTADIKEIPHG